MGRSRLSGYRGVPRRRTKSNHPLPRSRGSWGRLRNCQRRGRNAQARTAGSPARSGGGTAIRGLPTMSTNRRGRFVQGTDAWAVRGAPASLIARNAGSYSSCAAAADHGAFPVVRLPRGAGERSQTTHSREAADRGAVSGTVSAGSATRKLVRRTARRVPEAAPRAAAFHDERASTRAVREGTDKWAVRGSPASLIARDAGSYSSCVAAADRGAFPVVRLPVGATPASDALCGYRRSTPAGSMWTRFRTLDSEAGPGLRAAG
jgi:hypothetical protein